MNLEIDRITDLAPVMPVDCIALSSRPYAATDPVRASVSWFRDRIVNGHKLFSYNFIGKMTPVDIQMRFA